MSVQVDPVLLYDGDCAFCTSSVRVLSWMGPHVRVLPWQHADLPALSLTECQARESVQWVAPGGSALSGHRAIAAALLRCRLPWPLLGRILLLPGVSGLAARGYAWVAANRYRLPGGTTACALPAGRRP